MNKDIDKLIFIKKFDGNNFKVYSHSFYELYIHKVITGTEYILHYYEDDNAHPITLSAHRFEVLQVLAKEKFNIWIELEGWQNEMNKNKIEISSIEIDVEKILGTKKEEIE